MRQIFHTNGSLFYMFVYIECIRPSFHIIPGIFSIGNVSFTLENEGWGQQVNVVYVKRQDFALFLVVIIGMSTNCVCSYMF